MLDFFRVVSNHKLAMGTYIVENSGNLGRLVPTFIALLLRHSLPQDASSPGRRHGVSAGKDNTKSGC